MKHRFNRRNLVIGLTLVLLVLPLTASAQMSKTYGTTTVGSDSDSGHFAELWDLTTCPLTISAQVDLTGVKDNDGYGGATLAFSELGIREMGGPDFNPTGTGIWMITDKDSAVDTFSPEPTLDLDDKLLLQKAGGQAEEAYDLLPDYSGTLLRDTNYGFWFDRDGILDTQQGTWGNEDGVTYNTGGTYAVELALDASDGARLTVNGIRQGFYTEEALGGLPTVTPVGLTFAGVDADLSRMQVFYGFWGTPADVGHVVTFNNLTVTGCPVPIIIDGCDPGVQDREVGDGVTLSEQIAGCLADFSGKEAMRCVQQLLKEYKQGGLITGPEEASIMACVR